MPTLTIRRPAAGTAPEQGGHPKATIATDSGLRLVLPYAPNDVEHGGLSDTFENLDRPGRKPLVVYSAEGLRTTSFAVLLAHRDPQRPVEDLLGKLERIAGSGDRVTLSRLGALADGVAWNLTDVTVRTVARQHGTNAVTRAEASLTFTEAVDAVINVGPLTGGKKPKKGKKGGKGKADTGGKGGKGKATTQRYTVRAGDTLARIALRFYDDPNKWPRIAKASGLRNPRNLKPGTRLTIPPA